MNYCAMGCVVSDLRRTAFLSQVELGKTAEANKLGIFTDDSAKQEAGVRAWECFLHAVDWRKWA